MSKDDLKVVPLINTNTEEDEAYLATIRLDTAKAEVAVKAPSSFQVRKPPKHEFIRCHPTLELQISGIELKEESDGGIYLIAGNMQSQLRGEAISFVLRPYVNRAGDVRLWPIRLPDPEGKVNRWHESAAIMAAAAVKQWVRIKANLTLGEYEKIEARISLPDPEWPEITLAQMMRLAFTDKGRVIQDADHPVVRQLFGRL